MTPRKWPNIGWGSSKIQILKFDSIFLTDESPVDKKINLRKKSLKSDV